MNRRKFIAAGTIVAPFAAFAQAAPPTIGWLSVAARAESETFLAAFWKGMGEFGYFEGRNVRAEYRWAEGRSERLSELARDLAARELYLIVTSGNLSVTRAARDAAPTRRIVFSMGADPLAFGLAQSLNRPGGNLTGVSILTSEIAPKRLSQLRELMPDERVIGILLNSANASNVENYANPAGPVQNAAKSLGLSLRVFQVATLAEIQSAIDAAADQGIRPIMIAADALFTQYRENIGERALARRIALSGAFKENTQAGALTSYGPNYLDTFRLLGNQTARVLQGQRPAELPIMQPTKYEFVINLKTARALGVAVPPMLLALTDEVVE